MADEQVIIEIKVEDKEIDAASKSVDRLTGSIEDLEQGIKFAKKENTEFRKTQDRLEKDLKRGAISYTDYKDGIKNTSEQLKINNKIIAQSSIELSKQKAERSANIKLVKAETGTLEQLDAQASVLLKTIKGQSKATKEGRDEYARLEKQLDEVNKAANEQRQAFSDNTKNTANYKNSIIEALEALKKQEKAQKKNLIALNAASHGTNKNKEEQAQLALEIKNTEAELIETNKALKKYGENLNVTDAEIISSTRSTRDYSKAKRALNASAKLAGKGIKVFGKGLKAVMKIGILGMLSLLAGGLALIGKAFKQSANGSKVMNKSMAVMEGLFAALVTVVNKFAGFMLKAFEDPKTAIKELGELIKQNLFNRVEGVIDLFKALGAAITGDFAAATEIASTAVLKFTTGLAGEDITNFKDELIEASGEAENMAAKFLALESAQFKTKGTIRNLDKDIAVLNAELEVLNETLGDDTRNMEDMRVASEQALLKSIELSAQQEKRAKLNLNLINQELNLRKSSGQDIQSLLDQQAQAEVELTEARSNSAIQQQKIIIEQRKIERDQFEQNLDIFLDIQAKFKTAQEIAINDTSKSIDERKRLFKNLEIAQTANFNNIKKEYELYGVTATDIDDIIASSDTATINQKIKNLGLNEIANNRLREIVMERVQDEIDFADIQKKLDKEDIDRKNKANQEFQDIENEKKIFTLESDIENLERIEASDEAILELREQLTEALVEIEEEKLALLLENETLNEEERQALIAGSEFEILKIRKKAADDNIALSGMTQEEKLKDLVDFFGRVGDVTADFAGEEFRIFGDIAASFQTAFKDGEISAISAMEGASMAASAVFSAISELRKKDLIEIEANKDSQITVANELHANQLALIQARVDSGEITEEQAAAAREELAQSNADALLNIEQKAKEESNAIKLKEFKLSKAAAILEIGIQTAIAVAKAFALSPLTFGLPWSAAAGVLGLAQIAIVASKKPPEFGGGTSDIVNIGDSHASGNDVDVYGYSGNQKQYFGKVEKGEVMPVIRKSAANDYRISELNGRASSRGRVYADGTNNIVQPQSPQVQQEISQEALIEMFRNINIVVKVQDVADGLAKEVQVENNAAF